MHQAQGHENPQDGVPYRVLVIKRVLVYGAKNALLKVAKIARLKNRIF